MLHVTRYVNALFLLFVCAAVIAVTGATLLSTKDLAWKLGSVVGATALGVALALPYFFSYRATKSRRARQIKRAMVASTVLLALSGVAILFGFATDPAMSLGAFVWGLPALLAVNTFRKLKPEPGTLAGLGGDS
jgi:hypothetical protein